jgi:site-specific DNA-methyltransferase (adenine-specific)
MSMIELHHGDCLEVMKTIPDSSVDMIVTDPPYTSPTVHAFGRQVTKRLSDLSIQEFYFSEIKKEWSRILKPDAPVLVFCDDIYSAVLTGLFYEWKQTALLVWDKGRIGMGNPFRKQHELIFYANRGSVVLNKESHSHIPTVIKCPLTKQHHGAEKPVPLIEMLISGLSQKGDAVLDCFMGSGTTGVACANTGRAFIGIEQDAGYLAIARSRIEQQQKAA